MRPQDQIHLQVRSDGAYWAAEIVFRGQVIGGYFYDRQVCAERYCARLRKALDGHDIRSLKPERTGPKIPRTKEPTNG